MPTEDGLVLCTGLAHGEQINLARIDAHEAKIMGEALLAAAAVALSRRAALQPKTNVREIA